MHTSIRTAFQPIMSARAHIVAYEALLRFREGLEKPEARVSAIRSWEDSGYIRTIDVAVLKQAIAALDILHHSLTVTVNVSPITIDSDGPRYLRQLDSLGDRAKRIVIEVTEAASPSDPVALLVFARECMARGVRIAIDDCEPGLLRCSPNVLRLLRPKLVKLHRKAVSHAFQTLDEQPLRELVEIASDVGARAVAQGIDSQEKLDWVHALGIRYFQGFLVGHPRQFPELDRQAAFRELQFSQPPAGLHAAQA